MLLKRDQFGVCHLVVARGRRDHCLVANALYGGIRAPESFMSMRLSRLALITRTLALPFDRVLASFVVVPKTGVDDHFLSSEGLIERATVTYLMVLIS